MPDASAPLPPPPTPAYAPPPSYSPASTAPAPVTIRLPAGVTLWDLIGFVIILVGGILILVGFLLGDASYVAATSTPPNGTTAANDIEGFYIWTGIGAFLVILGYLCRALVFPMIAGRRKATPAAAPPTMSPSAPPATAPSAPAPVAAPATPACGNCGNPTTYIAQYGRYYCYSCSRYV